MVANLILEAGVERVAPTSAGVDAQSLEVLVDVVRCHAGKLARSVHVDCAARWQMVGLLLA